MLVRVRRAFRQYIYTFSCIMYVRGNAALCLTARNENLYILERFQGHACARMQSERLVMLCMARWFSVMSYVS